MHTRGLRREIYLMGKIFPQRQHKKLVCGECSTQCKYRFKITGKGMFLGILYPITAFAWAYQHMFWSKDNAIFMIKMVTHLKPSITFQICSHQTREYGFVDTIKKWTNRNNLRSRSIQRAIFLIFVDFLQLHKSSWGQTIATHSPRAQATKNIIKSVLEGRISLTTSVPSLLNWCCQRSTASEIQSPKTYYTRFPIETRLHMIT